MFPNSFDDPRLVLSHQTTPRRRIPGKLFGNILEGIIKPEPLFPSQEDAKKYLEERITQRRNDFIEEYRKGFHGTEVLTYEPALDREVYKELRKHKEINAGAYKETVKGLNTYTRFQVETFIGERLNVGLSKFTYDLRFTNDGVGIMYGHDLDEPLLDMIARGRDTRHEVAQEIDHPRQVAEVTQFEKIQEVFGNPEAAIGTTIVSVSPPGKEGSAYAHNFYDVFILKEDDMQKRYIEARRYASGLSIDESLQKAEELQPRFTESLKPDEQHVDAFLISRPIVLTEGHEYFNKPNEIHKFLQGDTHAMSYEDFQKKVVRDEIFSEMINYYIQTLEERPQDGVVLNQTLDAIMNRADEAAGLREAVIFPKRETRDFGRLIPLPIIAQINHYGMQEVRKTPTGCGSSGGLGQGNIYSGYGANRLPGNMSPTKSTDVASGEDNYGSRTFECPECHETNYRPYNELVPACQHCGTNKVAC